ncbi:MAG: C-terminal binding protein [Rhodospirillales bacterium]|nr:C-terminal binding protein [Rhodospirillales bacterium]
MRILIPDLGYPDADLEREVAGSDVTVDFYKWEPGIEAQITDESWRSCNALVLYEKIPVTSEIMTRLDNIKVVVRAGVGFDNVDIQGFGAMGIPVCNVPDYGTMDVAEHAIGLMLGLTRGITEHDARLSSDPIGEWMFHTPPIKRRILGLTFGVIGLGRIGTAAAMRAKGIGMNVLFYDPYLRPGIELGLGFNRAETLEELMANSDVISHHTPLTEETRGMINAESLSHVKKGAILINTGRGETVKLDAVYDALKSGQLDGAGLDVIEVEPPTMEEPLVKAWKNKEDWIYGRVTMTPHSAFHSPESIVTLRSKSVKTAVDFLRDGTLKNCINEQYLKR